MARFLVFSHNSDPSVDSPDYKLSQSRALQMVADGLAFPISERAIQKYAPKDASEEDLAEIGGDSKAALTMNDMQALVGIGGITGFPCPPATIRRAKARVKGWGESRIMAAPREVMA